MTKIRIASSEVKNIYQQVLIRALKKNIQKKQGWLKYRIIVHSECKPYVNQKYFYKISQTKKA